MSMSQELNQLAEMHQRGVLTDEEFARAKARVLGETGADASAKDNTVRSAMNGFRRSRDDRWLGGVCGGLARSWAVESWLLRMVFVLATLFACVGPFVYLLLWIFAPQAPDTAQRTRLPLSHTT